jgi:preprotein translocase subunit SecB
MKAKFSPLELLTFELLNSSYNFNVVKDEKLDIQKLFQSYSVNIDFDHFFEEDGTIRVFAEIKVNNLKKPKVGYELSVTGMGLFKIKAPTDVDEKILSNLKYYSTLNMMINNLRNIMFQISNIGPLGGYLLPPIDILDLFKKKNEIVKKKKKSNSKQTIK